MNGDNLKNNFFSFIWPEEKRNPVLSGYFKRIFFHFLTERPLEVS